MTSQKEDGVGGTEGWTRTSRGAGASLADTEVQRVLENDKRNMSPGPRGQGALRTGYGNGKEVQGPARRAIHTEDFGSHPAPAWSSPGLRE